MHLYNIRIATMYYFYKDYENLIVIVWPFCFLVGLFNDQLLA